MKTTMKKIGEMLLIMAYAIGALAGFGVAAKAHEWVPAVCVAVLAVLAWPTIKAIWKDWTDGK